MRSVDFSTMHLEFVKTDSNIIVKCQGEMPVFLFMYNVVLVEVSPVILRPTTLQSWMTIQKTEISAQHEFLKLPSACYPVT